MDLEYGSVMDGLRSDAQSESNTPSTVETADHNGVKKATGIATRTAPKMVCRFTKSRFFGRGHWMNKLHRFVEIHRISHRCYFDDTSDGYKLQEKCKRLARALKGPHVPEPPGRRIANIDVKSVVPSRAVCDHLLGLYFRTYNSTYRVLHKPTFEQELDAYWADKNAADDLFVYKLLLALSIGATFYTGQDARAVRMAVSSAASDVALACQTWHCVPLSKHALTEGTIQLFILSLLARQTNSVSVGGDDVWISAGALLRTATMMGLHRDPLHLCHVSIFRSEMRRRLWYGILEVLVQTSIDNGQLPMLASDEWDTAVPANVDDEELAEDMMSHPVSRPLDKAWTQSSVQCALARSLPLRLRVAKALNSFHSELSYEETLQMGKELSNECVANNKMFELCKRSCNEPDELRHKLFQLKLLDTLTRRFLLSLHTPFAYKSSHDPTYYYSRHVCLDSALKLLTYVTPTPMSSPLEQTPSKQSDHRQRPPISEDEYNLIKLRSRGTFRSILYDATTTVCLELTQQLREDPSAALFGPLPDSRSLPPMRGELYSTVKAAVETLKSRIWEGETNVKGFVFFATAMAQVDGMIQHSGRAGTRDGGDEDSIQEDLARAQMESLEEAWKILKSLMAEKEGENATRDVDDDVMRDEDKRDKTMKGNESGKDEPSELDAKGLCGDSFSNVEVGGEDLLDSLFFLNSDLSGDALGPWFSMELDDEDTMQF
ncbi:hypothetical protein ACJZ2D_012444 [Fusarium nematophilum]